MYFVFDLDETLAEIYTVYYFVASLQTYPTMSESLTRNLKNYYKKFVKYILIEELIDPLGILRPGILNIMNKLYELYKAGKVKGVIIYSNNGHLYNLEFIRDIIHEYIEGDLICECVHRFHPMRESNNKTWGELQKILTNGKCKARNVKPSDVYFFDDLKHDDLHKHLDNYYQVPEYNFMASFDRIACIYKDIVVDKEFIDVIQCDTIKNIDDVVEIFRKDTQIIEQNVEQNVERNIDDGINMMMDAIKKIGVLGKRRY